MVRLRSGGNDCHAQLVDTVAPVLRLVFVAIDAVGVDVYAVPVIYFALRQVFGLAEEIRVGLVQVDFNDTVASVGADHRVAYHSVVGVSHAFVGRFAAEVNCAIGALERFDSQVQGVDTVFQVAGLVFGGIDMLLADILVAQVCHAMPDEIFALANLQTLREVVLAHVLCQHQSPYFATTRLCVRELELICTRSVVFHRRLLSCRTVCPGVFVLSQRSTGLIYALWVFVNIHFHYRVATQVVEEPAALLVSLAVEDHLLVVADGEGGVNLYDRTDGQMQAVVVISAVGFLFRAAVVAALACADAVPYYRQLALTCDDRGVYRIYMVDSQLQYRYAVAAEAVRAIVEIRAGLVIYLVVPFKPLAFVHMVNQAVRVRMNHIEAQVDDGVATAVAERVLIFAALR